MRTRLHSPDGDAEAAQDRDADKGGAIINPDIPPHGPTAYSDTGEYDDAAADLFAYAGIDVCTNGADKPVLDDVYCPACERHHRSAIIEWWNLPD